jgi:hypothetical protein
MLDELPNGLTPKGGFVGIGWVYGPR